MDPLEQYKRELIKSIRINEANVSQIAKSGIISGSLLMDLLPLFDMYANQVIIKPSDSKLVEIDQVKPESDDHIVQAFKDLSDMHKIATWIVSTQWVNEELLKMKS